MRQFLEEMVALGHLVGRGHRSGRAPNRQPHQLHVLSHTGQITRAVIVEILRTYSQSQSTTSTPGPEGQEIQGKSLLAKQPRRSPLRGMEALLHRLHRTQVGGSSSIP